MSSDGETSKRCHFRISSQEEAHCLRICDIEALLNLVLQLLGIHLLIELFQGEARGLRLLTWNCHLSLTHVSKQTSRYHWGGKLDLREGHVMPHALGDCKGNGRPDLDGICDDAPHGHVCRQSGLPLCCTAWQRSLVLPT